VFDVREALRRLIKKDIRKKGEPRRKGVGKEQTKTVGKGLSREGKDFKKENV